MQPNPYVNEIYLYNVNLDGQQLKELFDNFYYNLLKITFIRLAHNTISDLVFEFKTTLQKIDVLSGNLKYKFITHPGSYNSLTELTLENITVENHIFLQGIKDIKIIKLSDIKNLNMLTLIDCNIEDLKINFSEGCHIYFADININKFNYNTLTYEAEEAIKFEIADDTVLTDISSLQIKFINTKNYYLLRRLITQDIKTVDPISSIRFNESIDEALMYFEYQDIPDEYKESLGVDVPDEYKKMQYFVDILLLDIPNLNFGTNTTIVFDKYISEDFYAVLKKTLQEREADETKKHKSTCTIRVTDNPSAYED